MEKLAYITNVDCWYNSLSQYTDNTFVMILVGVDLINHQRSLEEDVGLYLPKSDPNSIIIDCHTFSRCIQKTEGQIKEAMSVARFSQVVLDTGLVKFTNSRFKSSRPLSQNLEKFQNIANVKNVYIANYLSNVVARPSKAIFKELQSSGIRIIKRIQQEQDEPNAIFSFILDCYDVVKEDPDYSDDIGIIAAKNEGDVLISIRRMSKFIKTLPKTLTDILDPTVIFEPVSPDMIPDELACTFFAKGWKKMTIRTHTNSTFSDSDDVLSSPDCAIDFCL